MLIGTKENPTPTKRWLDVRFGKDIPSEKLKSIQGHGYIITDSESVYAPDYYEIGVKTDRNGVVQFEQDGKTPKKAYPHVYVKDFEKFVKVKKAVKQSQFVTDEEDTDESEF